MSTQPLFNTHLHPTENRRAKEQAQSRDGGLAHKVFFSFSTFFFLLLLFLFDVLNRKERRDYFPSIRLFLPAVL
jgi:hypothetical protein